MNNVLVSLETQLNHLIDDHVRIKILQEHSRALEKENIQQALELLQQAIALAEAHLPDDDYLPALAECLHRHGFLCDQLADYGTALVSYNRALELFKSLGRHLDIAREENHIGVVFGRLGDHSTSIQHLLAAHRIFEDQQETSQQAILLNNIGFSYVLINEHKKALSYLLKGLKLARETDHAYAQAITLDSLCHAYRGLKNFENALAYGLESVQVCQAINDQRSECEYSLSVGVVYMARGQIHHALQYFEKSRKLAEKLGFRREEAEVLRRLATISFQQGQPEQAFSHLQRALNIAQAIEARHEIFKTHADLAAAYKQIGDFEKALAHYEQFHTIREEVFNDQADMRFKSLETAHRLEQAQKEAEIYQLKNQALQTEIEERKVAQAQAEHIATIDPLTGLFNRRHFFHLAEHAFTKALYDTTPLCVIMLDLDHFKEVNDTYGHLIGDKVLIAAANTIHHGLRTSDILGRYGGEEFSAILPDTTLEQGYLVAERIRDMIETLLVETEKGPVSITLSCGVGKIFVDDSFSTLTLNVLIDRADQALYQAKQAGRNRTVVFEP
jgi:diguanylate cyclase (GGDEF)-like protein